MAFLFLCRFVLTTPFLLLSPEKRPKYHDPPRNVFIINHANESPPPLTSLLRSFNLEHTMRPVSHERGNEQVIHSVHSSS